MSTRHEPRPGYAGRTGSKRRALLLVSDNTAVRMCGRVVPGPEVGAARNEAGLIFDATGAPTLVYGFFADSLGDLDNYGATHPAVHAHAVLGRTMFDAVDRLTNPVGRPTRP